MTALPNLPSEIWVRVAYHLLPASIHNICQTCHTLNKALTSEDVFRHHYLTRYPPPHEFETSCTSWKSLYKRAHAFGGNPTELRNCNMAGSLVVVSVQGDCVVFYDEQAKEICGVGRESPWRTQVSDIFGTDYEASGQSVSLASIDFPDLKLGFITDDSTGPRNKRTSDEIVPLLTTLCVRSGKILSVIPLPAQSHIICKTFFSRNRMCTDKLAVLAGDNGEYIAYTYPNSIDSICDLSKSRTRIRTVSRANGALISDIPISSFSDLIRGETSFPTPLLVGFIQRSVTSTQTRYTCVNISSEEQCTFSLACTESLIDVIRASDSTTFILRIQNTSSVTIRYLQPTQSSSKTPRDFRETLSRTQPRAATPSTDFFSRQNGQELYLLPTTPDSDPAPDGRIVRVACLSGRVETVRAKRSRGAAWNWACVMGRRVIMATRGGVLAAVDFDDGGWVESAELGGSDVRQVFVGVCAVGVVGNGMIWGWHFGSACGPRCWWRRVETFLMA